MNVDVLLKMFSIKKKIKKEKTDYNALWLYTLWIEQESPGV